MAVALLIKNGELYGPGPMGKMDILIIQGKIICLGSINEEDLKRAGFSVEVIDASGCTIIPGLIDPHEHLLGGSGESGFGSRTPEIHLSEIVGGGITTVVGCLGTDTITRNMPALLGHAKALNDEGITAYIYSGGYPVPPDTLTGSILKDMLLVPEVIGAGETAISDARGSQPTTHMLAVLAAEVLKGKLLTGRGGVVHLHLGDGKCNLSPVREMVEKFDTEISSLYPTHINRRDDILREAAELSCRGLPVDIDVYDQDLTTTLPKFVEYGGNLENLTLSTDAGTPSPRTLFEQVRKIIKEKGWKLEKILPLVTTNPARILNLSRKGHIKINSDADLVILDADYQIRDVFAQGQVFVRNSKFIHEMKALKNSNRIIEIYGKKAER